MREDAADWSWLSSPNKEKMLWKRAIKGINGGCHMAQWQRLCDASGWKPAKLHWCTRTGCFAKYKQLQAWKVQHHGRNQWLFEFLLPFWGLQPVWPSSPLTPDINNLHSSTHLSLPGYLLSLEPLEVAQSQSISRLWDQSDKAGEFLGKTVCLFVVMPSKLPACLLTHSVKRWFWLSLKHLAWQCGARADCRWLATGVLMNWVTAGVAEARDN